RGGRAGAGAPAHRARAGGAEALAVRPDGGGAARPARGERRPPAGPSAGRDGGAGRDARRAAGPRRGRRAAQQRRDGRRGRVLLPRQPPRGLELPPPPAPLPEGKGVQTPPTTRAALPTAGRAALMLHGDAGASGAGSPLPSEGAARNTASAAG